MSYEINAKGKKRKGVWWLPDMAVVFKLGALNCLMTIEQILHLNASALDMSIIISSFYASKDQKGRSKYSIDTCLRG